MPVPSDGQGGLRAQKLGTLHMLARVYWYYFVLRNLNDLLRLAALDVAPVYERVSRLTELAPGELLPEDELWSRGHGGYHATAAAR